MECLRVDDLLYTHHWELVGIAFRLGGIDGRADGVFELGKYATCKHRQDGINFGVRELGIMEHFDEFLEG